MSQLLNLSVQDLQRHRGTAVALLPVVLPAVYVVYLNLTIRRTTSCSSGQLNPPPSSGTSTAASSPAAAPITPESLPEEVAANPGDWVVCYERVVSRPLSASSLVHKLLGHNSNDDASAETPSPLLKTYLRATYKAFSWTPQAFLIRAMLAEPDRRASFAAAHIDELEFARGDVVDGVYAVTSYGRNERRGVEVIELSLDVPASYRGPPVRGLIMSAIEEGKDGVVFVNETWLWRKKDEKPTLLETGFGRWFHSLLAGWLITKGLGGVRK
ncbi:hypothetical protein NLG97_g10273 [Lecanicillium saksenae]|uniref:Uncharacterized protein n=1 Tax=Lecanicillium saksenae TaxID=468837 RepID=A0ACC1QDW5_9HYPO|nr:hypothetical protein NLG97_g10273 [Lecanicillium saksenae]